MSEGSVGISTKSRSDAAFGDRHCTRRETPRAGWLVRLSLERHSIGPPAAPGVAELSLEEGSRLDPPGLAKWKRGSLPFSGQFSR